MRRVLIVDDGPFMRTLIAGMLQQQGYNVIDEAEDGAEGVKKYQELKPDVVTMDITMPHMDGLQALQAILKDDPEAVIVMISAVGDEETIREAIKIGAKGFLVKPFSAETLCTVLEDAIKYAKPI